MSKQTFKIGKNFIPNILVLSSSAVLALFATLILVAPVAETTSAVDTPNLTDGLSLVTNKTIEANIHPEENGSLSIIKDTIVGSTNSPYGYEIYISANSDTENSIYLNGNPENIEATQKITATTGTYDAPVALDLTNGATWGYAIAGLDNFDASYNIYTPSATAKFAAMPTVDNKQLIRSSSTAVSDDTIDIYYGINADSTLEPGIYKTEILYTALPIIPPSTAKAILGDNGNLNFVYDYSTYTVGDTYEDNIGDTEIVAIYNVPTDSYAVLNQYNDVDTTQSNIPQWAGDNTIVSANFDSSFYNFEPTSTSLWFYQMRNLESMTGVEYLNTAAVTDMSYMFSCTGYNVAAFDIGDIGVWDVSNVTNMAYMFNAIGHDATTWNIGNLGYVDVDHPGWNVGNVTNMSHMFIFVGGETTDFNIGDLSSWNVSNVTDMSNMFYRTGFHADTFSIGDLSSWNVSNVTDMSYMFYESGYNSTTWNIGNLGYVDVNHPGWNVGNVTNMSHMFDNAGYNLTTTISLGNLNSWNVSNVKDMSYMFYEFGRYATTWSIGDLGYVDADHRGWNVSNVEDMSHMFDNTGKNATIFNIGNIGSWNVGSVTDMSYMFRAAGWSATTWSIGDLSGWDVSSVIDMNNMFNDAGDQATTWDIGNLGYVDVDHTGWNVSSVTNMSNMFYQAGWAATTWNIGDISSWNVQNVTNHYDFIVSNYNSTNTSVVNNQPVWQPQP